MRSLFRLVVLILLVTGWALAAASLHAVRLPSATCPLLLIPRASLATSIEELRETYVDTRQWTMEDAARHPVLLRRIVQAEKSCYLEHVGDPDSGLSLEAQLIEAAEQGEDAQREELLVRKVARPLKAVARAELASHAEKLRRRQR